MVADLQRKRRRLGIIGKDGKPVVIIHMKPAAAPAGVGTTAAGAGGDRGGELGLPQFGPLRHGRRDRFHVRIGRGRPSRQGNGGRPSDQGKAGGDSQAATDGPGTASLSHCMGHDAEIVPMAAAAQRAELLAVEVGRDVAEESAQSSPVVEALPTDCSSADCADCVEKIGPKGFAG